MILTIINIIKNYKKYILIALLIAIAGYIAYLNINIASKKNKIKDLNNKVVELETTNNYLYKDLTVKSNDIKIINDFSNSIGAIQLIENKNLTENELRALNTIISDYYK